ncbi:MAG: hypothetical protein K0S04_308 [Herbinix sp.]|jgi:hypothetical protein|nr:hypothetical protein [Herbinix sp.]
MAVYRMIHISFWQDSFVLNLTPEEKYFYIYLMTNSKTNQIGCYELPMKIIEMETGYVKETVEKLLSRFQDNYGKIKYCGSELLLRNWHKYSWSKSPKVFSCMKNEYESIKNPEFKSYIERLFIDYGYSNGTLSEDYGEKEKEKKEEEKEKEYKKNKSEHEKKYSDGSFEMKCVNYLISSIKTEMPGAILPRADKEVEKWCDHIEKMLRLDKRPQDVVYKVLEYARTDNFWKANIRSTSKLREKYETLYSQMVNKKSQQPKPQQTQQNKFNNHERREYSDQAMSEIEKKLLNKSL